MRRHVFTAASALSLALCLAAAVLWVRSYSVADLWEGGYWRENPGPIPNMVLVNEMEFDQCRGRWMVRYLIGYLRPPSHSHWFHRQPESVGWDGFIDSSFWHEEGTYAPHHLPGGLRFRYDRGSWDLGIPDYLPVLLAGVLPLLWLWRRVANRRQTRMGFCPRCGYDLRASADRCPECGISVPTTNASTSA